MPWTQPVQTSKHGNTRYLLDRQETKKIETINETKKINGWNILFQANDYGKLTIVATKTLGMIGKGFENGKESTLTFRLETTDNLIPKFRSIDARYKQFVELQDNKDRTTESYKQYQDNYPREYAHSSVLTVSEFLSEFTDFEKILGDTKLDGYVLKISDQVSQLEQPHNKQYKKLVK